MQILDIYAPEEALYHSLISHESDPSLNLNPPSFIMNRSSAFNRCLPLLAALMGLSAPLQGKTVTWTGDGGEDYLWSDEANWDGGLPSATGDVLVFAGSAGTATSNDYVTGVNGILFDASAAAFTIEGGTLVLSGNVTNESNALQTFEHGFTLAGSYTIDTGPGGIRVGGAIGQSSGTRQLEKRGTGELFLKGTHGFTGNMVLRQGSVLLDASGGGGFAAGGNFSFGVNSATTRLNQGGTFKVEGSATVARTIEVGKALYIGRSSGLNRIVVDAKGGPGTTLQFSNLNRLAVSSDGVPTLHVDLSSPGSALKLDASTHGMSNGVYFYVTVTDGVKTGFATRDAVTGLVTRFTPVDPLPVVTGSSATDYQTSGSLTLTGDVASNTVTLTGGGSMNGNYNLNTGAILMEEGVGDYTMNINSVGRGFLTIHQHSTSGELRINGNLRITSGNYSGYSLAKTGAGVLSFGGSAAGVGGAVDVQEGRLRLDGSLSDVQIVQVRGGATLSGSGSIGGGTAWSYSGGNINDGTRYTPVNIWSGGTLDATHITADALEITGQLTLHTGATFRMEIGEGVFSALNVVNQTPDATIVTLDGDLRLSLSHLPPLGEAIELLTWSGGTRSGEFATINGVTATPLFALNYLTETYYFEINYGENSIWITQAIPEPGTVALLGAGAVALGLRLARRRRGR